MVLKIRCNTIILFFLVTFRQSFQASSNFNGQKPHIIVIIADDLGWNDVGFHGSNQIPTPNIDALAYNGIILDKSYTQFTCTPSRAAFLTGNYPIRAGMQGYPLKGGENRSLPMDMPTMPEQLKKLGYKTHLIGKWHLGAAYRANTPTGRGFDTHFGYWNGFVDYFGYTSFSYGPNHTHVYGFDLHDGFDTVWNGRGHYATDLFTDKATEIIDKHDVKQPLFLVISHLAPHTGKDGVELEVPDANLTHIKYSYIKEPQRRFYADVVNLLDESVGTVVQKLSEKDMLKNSIVLFTSDNGAQTVGMYQNYGSNWPMRGMKFTEFEGGVRCAAAIFSPLFNKRNYVSKELIHLTDWLPTFYKAAGGDLKDLGNIDGVDQWETLSNKLPTNRSEILLNIYDADNVSAIITDHGQYKYIQATYDGLEKYEGDSGRDENLKYNITKILQSNTNVAITGLGFEISPQQILQMRKESDLSWSRNDSYEPSINCAGGCLFDLFKDPCETTNIIESKPEVAIELMNKLQEFRSVVVPQKKGEFDPASNPLYYNNTWCTWLDDSVCTKTPQFATH